MARPGTPPPSAPVDPKSGRNPGYAEEHPDDRRDAHRPAEPARPSPDEPDIGHDADATPSPGQVPPR
jgi:hypothetical protein